MIAVIAALAIATGSPAPLAITPPPTPAVITIEEPPAFWRCIAHYESSDRLSVINPVTGDGGIFQIDPRTLAAYAPPGFPARAELAGLAEQYVVAEAIYAADGPWPWETADLCGGLAA